MDGFSMKLEAVGLNDRGQDIKGICEIDGKSVEIMAHTGATMTIMHSKLIPKDAVIEPTKIVVRTCSGRESVEILETKMCQIIIDEFVMPLKALKGNNLAVDCLLGMDILDACPATKDIRKQLRVVVGSNESQMRSNIVAMAEKEYQ